MRPLDREEKSVVGVRRMPVTVDARAAKSLWECICSPSSPLCSRLHGLTYFA